MDIIQIAGVCIVFSVIFVLLKQYKKEYALLAGIAAGIVILLLIFTKAQPVFSAINGLSSRAGIKTEYLEILLKALGICFVTQFAVDVCKDAGEQGMASKVELAGKFAVLLIALPLFTQVANLAVGLING